MVTANQVSASIRLLDSQGYGIRTVGGVRHDMSNLNAARLMSGFNAITQTAVAGAVLTARAELVRN